MKQNYRMTLQYEGTKYNGWQKQGFLMWRSI